MAHRTLYPALAAYISRLEPEGISSSRKDLLSPFAYALSGEKTSVVLNFICTHNSRRSQFAQVWAHIWAFYFGYSHVKALSSGTEATACHPHTLQALKKAGLQVQKASEGDNPVYRLYFADDAPPILCYSKRFEDQEHIPASFWALMTCSDADENCPLIPQASHRFSLNYLDPKVFDGSAKQEEAYDERCRQISTELMWVFKPSE